MWKNYKKLKNFFNSLLRDIMTKKIILLNGKAGSGKDYLANWLVENKGYIKMAFADELKKMTASWYNVPIETFLTQEGKNSYLPNKFITARTALISTAKNIKRNDIYFFVKIIKDKIDEAFEKGIEKIVISDYRFIEEYYYLMTYYREYLETIHIERKNHRTYVFDASETALQNFLFMKKIENPDDETTNEEFSRIFIDY
jgi:hypothetical protein